MGNFGVWFKGLRGKLLFMVVLPTVVVACLCAMAFKELRELGEHLENASNVRLPLTQYSGEMNSYINGALRMAWTSIAADTPEERGKGVQRTRDFMKDYHLVRTEYLKLPRSEKMKELFKPVEEHNQAFIDGMEKVINLAAKGDPKEDQAAAAMIKAEVRPVVAQIQAALALMDETRKAMAAEESAAQIKNSRFVEQMILLMGALSSLAIFAIGIFIASRLARVLGDVTQRISDAGSQVSSASEQLSSASQQLSSGATEAASSLEETVSSIEELSSMVKLNSDNAKEASSLSLSSRKSAEDGENEIKNLIGAMTDISKSSKKIEEIINVIDDIAFQTNLLALNAAVEAARAGEQGKGFAVVAEAVRTLAQRSSSAAKDITDLIKESVEKITNGSKIADQSGEVLKNIVTSVKKVSDLNNEIASASAEQSNGISQISKAMNELDQATQRNAASAEETAASAEEMSAQAIELQGLVTDLSTVIEGAGEQGPRPQAAPAARRHTTARPAAAPLRAIKGGGQGSSSKAEKAIPFDDDSFQGGKVGTTDGF